MEEEKEGRKVGGELVIAGWFRLRACRKENKRATRIERGKGPFH